MPRYFLEAPARAVRLGGQEIGDGADELLALLQHDHVTALRQHDQARPLNQTMELFPVGGRDQAIGFAPEEEGGRLNAMDALCEAAVRNGPEEFSILGKSECQIPY